MDKQTLLQAIIDHFEGERETASHAARVNYEAATHEENRAENKYDTRGLEASYMAASQGKRALELKQTISIYMAMKPKDYDENDDIDLGALVELEGDHETLYYFVGPRGGGVRVSLEGKTVTIITAAAPLGRRLMGAAVGDEVETPGSNRIYEITGLS